METRHEACSAEGQPRNILKCNPSRFAGRCPALSRRCHRVIHSCYAFLSAILRKSSLAIVLSPPAMTPEVNISASDASAPGLTMRQCEGRKLHRSGTAADTLAD